MHKKEILDSIRSIFKFPILERIIVLFTQQQKYGGWMKVLIPNHYQFPEKSIRECTRGEIKYKLDISDLMDWYIYFGFREIEKDHFFMAVKKDDIIFDVGANLGQFTLNSAKTASQGKVFSFEPDPANYLKIQHNISINRLTNISLQKVALGEVSGKGEMKVIDNHNTGMNKLIPDNAGGIEITTLDHFIEANNISKVDKIKIDTEGFELNILKGSKRTLTEHHPYLFLEIDDRNLKEQGTHPNEIFEYLGALNYRIYLPANLKEIDIKASYDNCHMDIIAI